MDWRPKVQDGCKEVYPPRPPQFTEKGQGDDDGHVQADTLARLVKQAQVFENKAVVRRWWALGLSIDLMGLVSINP